jgi:hypothetical protein
MLKIIFISTPTVNQKINEKNIYISAVSYLEKIKSFDVIFDLPENQSGHILL